MASGVDQGRVPGLERSCGTVAGDWIKAAPPSPGIERIEAFFTGHGFDPHRHDTYAIGYTVGGVQSFRYRGASEHSVPGKVFVLHPDELHDGHAGTDIGFRYRILYVDPGLILDALDGAGRPLPFVRETVSDNAALLAALVPALGDLDRPLEELQRDQIAVGLADALAAADPSIAVRRLSTRHWRAVDEARALLDAGVETGVASTELEVATGLTRYALARHFRACLGTSPYRYLVMRRLDYARSLIRRGTPLAEAAAASGFADQAHMTRHFKKTFGIAPGRWAAITGPAGTRRLDK
jgi:AraC-like DNA-binding protein